MERDEFGLRMRILAILKVHEQCDSLRNNFKDTQTCVLELKKKVTVGAP
jgi:hypothetical protein